MRSKSTISMLVIAIACPIIAFGWLRIVDEGCPRGQVEDVGYSVACTRQCGPLCPVQEGNGLRAGVRICTTAPGLKFVTTWKFQSWLSDARSCDAPDCAQGYADGPVSYSSMPDFNGEVRRR